MHIFFEKENIRTDSMDSELFLTILSAMAESESVSISENNKWVVQHRFMTGTYKQSYAPFGYDSVGETLVVNPAEAEIVRRIFAETLSGKSAEAVAKALNAEGILPRIGKQWGATSVRKILCNEKYKGDALFQKTYTDSLFYRHPNNDQKLPQYYVTDHHEAIVSVEDFDAVQALIEQHSAEKHIQKGDDKYNNRYGFSGKIICGKCGNTFKRRKHSDPNGGYIAWCCRTHLKDSKACTMLYIRDEDIKLAFVTMMNKLIFAHKTILDPYRSALQEEAYVSIMGEKQQCEQEIRDTEKRMATLAKFVSDGIVDATLFAREKNLGNQRIQALQREIKMLESSIHMKFTTLSDAEHLCKFAEDAAPMNAYDDNIFSRFVHHIEVESRTKIRFYLRCGLCLQERIG